MSRYASSCEPSHWGGGGAGLSGGEGSDSLTRASMRPLLTDGLFVPEQYHFHPIMDSTNREAMTLAHGGAPQGTVIVADQQTNGRGRHGRTWASPPGVNLYFSMILRPAMPACHAPRLTLLAGLALVESVVAAGVEAARIKWPNDILVHGRKLAGILTEMASDGDRVRFVTVGVGVNVNGSAARLPPEVAARAITLEEITRKRWARELFLADFLRIFAKWYIRYLQEGFAPVRQGWLGHARMEGRRMRIQLPAGVVTGSALGLDEEGFLLVEQEDGVVSRVMAGEVEWLDRG
ncbi:MAG: biotin--[acetyl-CoA-carboxylase] ligase [Magnetococcales bacterium]|nr:biotin--[acetyl-CoA-carboxylase] ligase [Magnetococcales bacterium]